MRASNPYFELVSDLDLSDVTAQQQAQDDFKISSAYLLDNIIESFENFTEYIKSGSPFCPSSAWTQDYIKAGLRLLMYNDVADLCQEQEWIAACDLFASYLFKQARISSPG